MKFEATTVEDARLIRMERHADARGIFMRTWCAAEFEAAGVSFRPVQSACSLTLRRGTIRGMHFQHAPASETKLVRCPRGSIWDVITDLRPGSQTFSRSFGAELSEENGAALFIPAGCAHGFQTLEDDSVVDYAMDTFYAPALADGFRHDDPAVGIDWPLAVTMTSERDAAWPSLRTRDFWHGASGVMAVAS